MSIYHATPEELGTFDLVFCGSILIHLRDPALETFEAFQTAVRVGRDRPAAAASLVDEYWQAEKWGDDVEAVLREHPAVLDVRVLAATNRDPATQVSLGQMREDLYYRLAVLTVCLPPLRDRDGDIELLYDVCDNIAPGLAFPTDRPGLGFEL